MHVLFYGYTDQGPIKVENYNWPDTLPIPNIGEETYIRGIKFLVNRKVIDPLFNCIQLYTTTSASDFELK